MNSVVLNAVSKVFLYQKILLYSRDSFGLSVTFICRFHCCMRESVGLWDFQKVLSILWVSYETMLL